MPKKNGPKENMSCPDLITLPYLTDRPEGQSIPLSFIAPDKLEHWQAGLTPAQKRWAESHEFTAKRDQIITLADAAGNLAAVAVGQGTDAPAADVWGLAAAAKNLPAGDYHLVDGPDPKLLAIGWALAQYRFDRYQEKKNTHVARLVLGDDHAQAQALVNGLAFTRDLVNIPTCDMGPSHLSAILQKLAAHYGAEFSETVGDDLLAHGYNTIHAVGRAAAETPRLLDMRWGRADAPRVTLVGKGVCFDTGGLDLKPSSGMRIMKKDMGGAAHVMGLARIIMDRRLNVRLRVLIPAVENNVAGNAYRPGDIITTYKGTTVEVDNTDAEGRLVLCDALALAAEEDPALLLDFATLTGAARVAVGTGIVPFFTDGEDLAAALADHAGQQGDPLWRLPLHSDYKTQLSSSCADLSNAASSPFGGAITAALFLKHFVQHPDRWVHFDVYAWNNINQPGRPQGGEAMAIRATLAYLNARFGSC